MSGDALPRFSIATPTRNALQQLRRCVGSVRGQTGVSLEHLVQDATSSDGTPDWLAAQFDLRAVSEPDAGMYDAINRAWSRANGDVLSWLNADEQYLPGTLATVGHYLQAHPEVDVVWGDAIVVDAEGKAVALRREPPFRAAHVANSFLYTMSCTLFFRRRLLERGWLAFDTRYRYAGDMDLMLRLAAHGAVVHRLPSALSLFGVDGGNLSGHARMAQETEEIARRHGASRLRAVRLAYLVARRLERWALGAYGPHELAYRFAIDETPRYVEIRASRVGGRYAIATATGRADSIRPLPPEVS